MRYAGSCHCGKVAYEVEGDLQEVGQCNCSICSRKGYLHWFLPREALNLKTPESALSYYTFNKHHIKHYFCPDCGCAPFGMGKAPGSGAEMVAVNVRCLADVDLAGLKVKQFDGKSL